MQALLLLGGRSDTRTENRGFIPFEVKYIEVIRGKRILDKRLDLCDVLLVDFFGAQRSSAARDGINDSLRRRSRRDQMRRQLFVRTGHTPTRRWRLNQNKIGFCFTAPSQS